MKTVALIVARKGSKRIPGKNMREMCGRPLFYWCMDAARKAKLTDEVWVATDDSEIMILASMSGVRVFKAREMDDDCIQETIIQDFLEVSDFTDLVLMQATSPLVTAEDIDGACGMQYSRRHNSVVSVVRKTYCTYYQLRDKFFATFQADPWPHKGQIKPLYIGNGAFWIFSREHFGKTGSRIAKDNIGLYEMPEDTLYEVDTETDWIIVERLLQKRLQ